MHQALIIYIIIQSLLFGIVLIFGRKPENKQLVFYFIYLFLFHVFFLFTEGDFWHNYSNGRIVVVIYGFIALCNSAVVLFFLYSILKKPIPKPLYLLWLIPVLQIISDYSFRTFDLELYSAGFYKNWYLSFPFYIKIVFTGLLIWQIKVFNKEIKENGPSKEHHQIIELYWGKYFAYFQLISSSALLLYMLFTLANGRLYQINVSAFVYSPDYYNLISRGFTTFFLLVFGYLALRNPSVFNALSPGINFEQKLVEIVLPEEEKSFQNKIELTDEQRKQYAETLNKLIENDKVYLDPELSLSKLAKLSGIPSRQLSQIIQTTFHKKYKEYINSYRVMHAQKLLAEKNVSNYTMYAIAFDSGFNSESSFYTIFKYQTSLTPKQYRDQNSKV
jgi:AraC-like DNA-binding protein